jgi:nitroreductase
MELLEGIESRTSALKLGAPGPTREHLDRIIRAGLRAPDHGRLRPWRFVVLEGEARRKLGDAMARMLQARIPDAGQDQLETERNKALRAPMIVVAAAHITAGKTPQVEQIIAVGAAVQNMLLAAHALGYGAMWRTGPLAYDASVKSLLGLTPEDHIVALIYLGTTTTAGPLVPAPIEGIVHRL